MKIPNKTKTPPIQWSLFLGTCVIIYTLLHLWCLYTQVNAGYSVGELFTTNFSNIFFPCLGLIMLTLCIYWICERKKRLKLAQETGKFEIEYFDFQKDYITIVWQNHNFNIGIPYSNIETLHLNFHTSIREHKGSKYPHLDNVDIIITSNQREYFINYNGQEIGWYDEPVIYKIYEIIYLAKNVQELKYSFDDSTFTPGDFVLGEDSSMLKEMEELKEELGEEEFQKFKQEYNDELRNVNQKYKNECAKFYKDEEKILQKLENKVTKKINSISSTNYKGEFLNHLKLKLTVFFIIILWIVGLIGYGVMIFGLSTGRFL